MNAQSYLDKNPTLKPEMFLGLLNSFAFFAHNDIDESDMVRHQSCMHQALNSLMGDLVPAEIYAKFMKRLSVDIVQPNELLRIIEETKLSVDAIFYFYLLPQFLRNAVVTLNLSGTQLEGGLASVRTITKTVLSDTDQAFIGDAKMNTIKAFNRTIEEVGMHIVHALKFLSANKKEWLASNILSSREIQEIFIAVMASTSSKTHSRVAEMLFAEKLHHLPTAISQLNNFVVYIDTLE